jgi:dihydropteroate synthase
MERTKLQTVRRQRRKKRKNRMRRPRLIDPGHSSIESEMALIGVDPAGIGIMEGKSRHHVIRLDDVDLRAALIMKQNMLSLGGDAALSRSAAGLRVETTPVLLMGTSRQLRDLVSKLGGQPFRLSELSRSIAELLDTIGRQVRYLIGKKDVLTGGRKTVVGILNVTPDSFSDGGAYKDKDSAVARGIEMSQQGAHIIDVGGESTRPGAAPVDVKEELERVIPVIRGLAASGVKHISVDTTRSEVAAKAMEEGASVINDISAMTFDPEMLPVAVGTGASVILMHTRGRPENMQNDLVYNDLMGEVCSSLEKALDLAVDAGIPVEKICLDPGIGFGKSLGQNLELIARIGELRSMGTCTMAGVSRKSFIGALTGAEVPERMPGSISAAVAAALKGADMVRVHDVAETVQAMAVVEGIEGTK